MGFIGINKWGIEPATEDQIAELQSVLPNSSVRGWPQQPYLVINMPRAEVRQILEESGYATRSDNFILNYLLYRKSSDHPNGIQVRQKPRNAPRCDRTLNLHFVLLDSTDNGTGECPNQTCTIGDLHNDPHNPITDLARHIIFDLIPYRLGFGALGK